MLKGFLHPDNAEKSTGGGGFKEGNLRVDMCVFRVHKGRVAEGQEDRAPVTAMVWGITRLNEDLEPLLNENDEPLTEELVFSLGGKSLKRVHPGGASSPEDSDEDVEDLDDEVNVEGPTVKLIDKKFRPHEKSGIMKLFASLKQSGFKEEYINRTWAPDYVGLVCHMGSEIDEDIKQKFTNREGKEIERGTPYKVVTKIITAPYESKGKKPAKSSDAKAPAAKSAANTEAETALTPILQKLSEDRDGSTMSRKTFNALVNNQLQFLKVSPKLHVPIMALVKDDAWVRKNAKKYDLMLDTESNTVTFGTPEEDAEAAGA